MLQKIYDRLTNFRKTSMSVIPARIKKKTSKNSSPRKHSDF